jgi:hypothetical protein
MGAAGSTGPQTVGADGQCVGADGNAVGSRLVVRDLDEIINFGLGVWRGARSDVERAYQYGRLRWRRPLDPS